MAMVTAQEHGPLVRAVYLDGQEVTHDCHAASEAGGFVVLLNRDAGGHAYLVRPCGHPARRPHRQCRGCKRGGVVARTVRFGRVAVEWQEGAWQPR